MGWVKGSDRNFEASQTERYRKTKKDRRERRETSGGDPKIRVRGRGSSTCAPGSGPQKRKKLQKVRKEKKIAKSQTRTRQDSNLRGETPRDF